MSENRTEQPVELPIKAALRCLIREAQAVADDHHRPRYIRLDEMLESAKATLAASDREVAKATGITLEDAAKEEVDLQALFRAFAKSVQGTANYLLGPYHAPGTIVIPEEEIEYWLKYIPPHSSTVRESGWVRVEDFRGEPNTSLLLWWWWNVSPDERPDIDEAVLDGEGKIEGKYGCGLDYVSHVKIVGLDRPAPPTTSVEGQQP